VKERKKKSSGTTLEKEDNTRQYEGEGREILLYINHTLSH